MSAQARFALRGRNPDVLTCIANLSNDEVFTPPEFANRMLDTLAEAWEANNGGADIWADKTVRFLDPFTKSGVFLREITSRLTNGLTEEMPNLEERVNHILTRQVFGIGITHLTSLLARRSLYCSKHAQGEHSIAKSFASDDGNIWFERTEHTWDGDKCKDCGASRKTLDRGEGFETHAYAFIHTNNINKTVARWFGGAMQFDVIIGNPPYQLNDGGYGTSAAPIYHLFVEQAKKLEPRYLSLVIPARWFAGGKGLDEFRESMLTDNRLRSIDDYLSASDVFPGVGLKGGVCYFVTAHLAWSRSIPAITARFGGRGEFGFRPGELSSYVTSSGTGTIPVPAESPPTSKTGLSRLPIVRLSKRACTCSSASMMGCRYSIKLLPSSVRNRSPYHCLTIGVSTNWLVPESRLG